MLKINRSAKSLTLLETPTLTDAAISERYDLQEYICNTPEAFFSELGQQLFLVGKEVLPSDNVQDRIDILGIDAEGCAVIVELKRGTHKLQMLQAISYAGMIAKWEPSDFLSLLSQERTEALTNFLEVDVEELNRRQRIILVAESFDYSVLIAAEWLSEKFGVEIVCCRLALATDKNTNSEFLVCSNVFPAPELAHQAAKRGKLGAAITDPKWADWDTALNDIINSDVKDFFSAQVKSGRECYLRKRILRFRINGKRRWFAAARRRNAYVWQSGRFDGDVEYWQSGISKPEDVGPVKDGTCLRLSLTLKKDFDFFLDSVHSRLLQAKWSESPAVEGDEELDDEQAAAVV